MEMSYSNLWAQGIIKTRLAGKYNGVTNKRQLRRRFDPQLLLSTCQSVLGQDTEPLIAPGGVVGALHGFLRHRCMNG